MMPPPEVLKIDLRIQVKDQPLIISAQVQGEGEHAQRAAAKLSAAIAAVLATLDKPADAALPTEGTLSQMAQTESAVITPDAPDAPPPSAIVDSRDSRLEGASTSLAEKSANVASPSLSAQMQRYRTQINLSLGGLLLALAVLVPAIVPPDERRDVLIMTILFGLTGALLLFTAMLPGPNQQTASASITPTPRRLSASPMKAEAAAARLRLSAKRRTPMKAGWGIALGAAFVLLGILAPFTLGATTADKRFIIMLGFAPITVVGFFLIAIFWRGLIAQQPAAPRPQPAVRSAGASALKRAPVARMPQSFQYRAIVPAAIIGLLAIMIIIVGVVIYATIASAAR